MPWTFCTVRSTAEAEIVIGGRIWAEEESSGGKEGREEGRGNCDEMKEYKGGDLLGVSCWID